MHTEQLEQVAAEIVRESKLELPLDAYALCKLAELEVRVGRPGCRPTVVGDTILVRPEDPDERRRFAACHELVHLCLRARGLPEDEWTVNYVASAVLHPRDWFMARLAARGWDIEALRTDCPWSSYEAIGRRIVHLRRAV